MNALDLDTWRTDATEWHEQYPADTANPAAIQARRVLALLTALDDRYACIARYEAENQTFLRDVMDEQERAEAAEARATAAESARDAAEGAIERVRALADEIEGSGRRYGYAVAHDLRAALDPAVPATRPAVIDAEHIEHQRRWSTATFGPREVRGPRGPLAHARKELDEVEEDPSVLEEWTDVIILAFDGAWRAGHEPQAIVDAVKAKQAKNEARTWPDWRGIPDDQAIEHVRHLDVCPVGGFHAYRTDTGRCSCGAPGPGATPTSDRSASDA